MSDLVIMSSMSQNKNPYAPKGNTHDYGSYFNLFHRYFEKRSEYPMVYEVEFTLPPDEPALFAAGFSKIFSHEFENRGSSVENMECCYDRDGMLVQFCRRESILERIDRLERLDGEEPEKKTQHSCRILYSSEDDLDDALRLITKFEDTKKSGRVYLMANMDGMLELQKFEIRLPSDDIDIRLNYGEEALSKFEKVSSLMKSNRNGLILFSGHPGTGKSTFIKMLAKETERKVIYSSSSSAEHLTNPEFISFIMRHRNSILLLEDAEKVLRSRSEQDNSSISNLLNITDGILGDCLNLLVIATFNIDREKIDPALVRKGRLLVEHHFNPLDADMANALLKSIGSDRKVSEPTCLAEIYNPEENFHEQEEIRKVGF